MNPAIEFIFETQDDLKFTLSNTNVSIANALRRTMITDIPSVVIKTELYSTNQCNIEINTTRFHNEIIAHRLSCIPIHIPLEEAEQFIEDYFLEVDVQNETEHTIYVTTEDFRIKSKSSGKYVTKEESKRIFPPHEKTHSYIDFVRLRPKISENIPGEQIKLTATFSISTAKENSMFTVVSTCTYSNTIDNEKVEKKWAMKKKALESTDMKPEEIEFHRKNFLILDAQREFVPNSFDYIIRTIGVYSNRWIVRQACKVLIDRIDARVNEVNSGEMHIKISETSMDNSYDIILENEDYTIGKMIEYLLYEKYYNNEKVLSFCGFKKLHPHDTSSIIRLAYVMPNSSGVELVRDHFRAVAEDAKRIIAYIGDAFKE